MRAKQHGRNRAWRIMFGSLAVLFASYTIRASRLKVRGDARHGLASSPEDVAKATSEGKLVLPAAANEEADVGPRFIGAAFGLLLTSLAIVLLGGLWLFPLPGTDRTLHVPLPLYPEPRLQLSPRQEMQRFLAAEYEQLTTYGWVDKGHLIVRIPIDEAMNRIAERGIPDWPVSAPAAAADSTIAAGSAR